MRRTGRAAVQVDEGTNPSNGWRRRLEDITPGKVEVETRGYEGAHGKAPRGRGMWAFHPNFNVDGLNAEIVWVSGLYRDAKRDAKRIAAGRGWPSIAVLS